MRIRSRHGFSRMEPPLMRLVRREDLPTSSSPQMHIRTGVVVSVWRCYGSTNDRDLPVAMLQLERPAQAALLLRWQKPILVMPRRASLGEQRNDHQLATARRLSQIGKVDVAVDEGELRQRLEALDTLKPRDAIGPYASGELTDAIRAFIAEGRSPRRTRDDADGNLRGRMERV